jgi:hypothetical protein
VEISGQKRILAGGTRNGRWKLMLKRILENVFWTLLTESINCRLRKVFLIPYLLKCKYNSADLCCMSENNMKL